MFAALQSDDDICEWNWNKHIVGSSVAKWLMSPHRLVVVVIVVDDPPESALTRSPCTCDDHVVKGVGTAGAAGALTPANLANYSSSS